MCDSLSFFAKQQQQQKKITFRVYNFVFSACTQLFVIIINYFFDVVSALLLLLFSPFTVALCVWVFGKKIVRSKFAIC